MTRIPDIRAEIEKLDALSRLRALTMAESLVLERLIYQSERGGTRRADYGSNRELARGGYRR